MNEGCGWRPIGEVRAEADGEKWVAKKGELTGIDGDIITSDAIEQIKRKRDDETRAARRQVRVKGKDDGDREMTRHWLFPRLTRDGKHQNPVGFALRERFLEEAICGGCR